LHHPHQEPLVEALVVVFLDNKHLLLQEVLHGLHLRGFIQFPLCVWVLAVMAVAVVVDLVISLVTQSHQAIATQLLLAMAHLALKIAIL
jgi:hypothetical protein